MSERMSTKDAWNLFVSLEWGRLFELPPTELLAFALLLFIPIYLALAALNFWLAVTGRG